MILNKPFYHKKTEEEISSLSIYNSSTFKTSECYYEKTNNNQESEWGCNDQDLINFQIINLPKNRRIVIFDQIRYNGWYDNKWHSDRKYLIDFYGYIIPEKKDYIAKYFQESYNLQSELDFLNQLESFQDKTPSWSHLFKFEDNYLKGAVFGQKLINQKFDTIIINNGFIVGRKNHQTNIYNYKLENISPKGIQSAFPMRSYRRNPIAFVNQKSYKDKDYAIALVNDKINYIANNGSVLMQLPVIVLTSIDDYGRDNRSKYISIMKDSVHYYFNVERRKFNYEDNKTATTSIFKKNIFQLDEYQSINFLSHKMLKNNKFEKIWDAYDTNISDYIVVQKNNKFGLFLIESKPTERGNNFTMPINDILLTEILPTEFEQIIRINGTDHILFSKNNLYAIYGLNEFPKYKKIEVSEYFSRFQLPNGQKGWLDKLGNEFIDK